MEPKRAAMTCPSDTFCKFPTNKKGEHVDVPFDKLAEWKETYPAVDVEQEIRIARQWCVDNPDRRKTQKGMYRFINNWLMRAQNRGGSRYQPQPFAGYARQPQQQQNYPRPPYLPAPPQAYPEWFAALEVGQQFTYRNNKYKKLNNSMYETIEGGYRVGNASDLW